MSNFILEVISYPLFQMNIFAKYVFCFNPIDIKHSLALGAAH